MPSKKIEKVCAKCGEVKWMQRESTYCSKRCARLGKPGARFPHGPSGAEHHNWSGDSATYLAAHKRIHRSRGPAREQTCACGKQASDWANLTGRYLDANDYEAMCRSCHKIYDYAREREQVS